MDKNDCIEIFNAMIRETPVSFNERILPMISEYLTEINSENVVEKISLIGQNPQLANNIFPDVVNHFCGKYNIVKVMETDKFNNLKTIMYYG